MPSRIAISVGHGQKIRGASCPPPGCDEVDEAKKIVDRVHELLVGAGVSCVKFFDTVSTSQSENLDRIVRWHDDQDRDRDVSVHLNAASGGSPNPYGCEVLYVTQEELAAEVSAAIAAAGHLKNRGAKYRGDLAFLNGTDKPAILLEVIFCDSYADTELLNEHHEAICVAIAETIADVSIGEQPEEPPVPVEPPDTLPTEENRVNIIGHAQGDLIVVINGVVVYRPTRSYRCPNTLNMTITMEGDVVVALNGEEFHNKPSAIPPVPPETVPPVDNIAENHRDIFATTFGGAADNEYSAYPPYDDQGRGPYLDDETLYVSLPYSFPPDAVPYVTVYNKETGKSACGKVMDKGPWTTDDDAFINGNSRPIAEQCYDDHEPLPSGPNKGQIPANPAGIDLSPKMFEVLGMTDNGLVDFEIMPPDYEPESV